MVRIFIGNTDDAWFDFLSRSHNIVEVNFWKPSPSNFAAISKGEIFAFRMKSPANKIGGFGTFTVSSVLPIQLAWDAFDRMNGVASLPQLIEAIARFRPNEKVAASTFIGCRVLVQPIFFPQDLWFDLPKSWSGNIVGGKSYSTDTEEGRALWDTLQERALLSSSYEERLQGFAETQARFGEPTLMTPRLGQGAFRVAIIEAYDRQCALTGGKVLPALEAAHIRPYSDGGTHSISNGVLLRKDIHSVFDAGYATFDESMRFVVSDKIRDIFNNGEEYRRLHGQRLRLPRDPAFKPDIDAIRWHNERFLG